MTLSCYEMLIWLKDSRLEDMWAKFIASYLNEEYFFQVSKHFENEIWKEHIYLIKQGPNKAV